jgi:hypothetical protein
LADQASQPLDLESLDPDAMLNAMIASFDGDQTELVQVITGLISRPAVYAIEYKRGLRWMKKCFFGGPPSATGNLKFDTPSCIVYPDDCGGAPGAQAVAVSAVGRGGNE